jgi:hypothetical protein
MTQITFEQGLDRVTDLVKRFSRPRRIRAGGQGSARYRRIHRSGLYAVR